MRKIALLFALCAALAACGNTPAGQVPKEIVAAVDSLDNLTQQVVTMAPNFAAALPANTQKTLATDLPTAASALHTMRLALDAGKLPDATDLASQLQAADVILNSVLAGAASAPIPPPYGPIIVGVSAALPLVEATINPWIVELAAQTKPPGAAK